MREQIVSGYAQLDGWLQRLFAKALTVVCLLPLSIDPMFAPKTIQLICRDGQP
jgi:hypothetical protein